MSSDGLNMLAGQPRSAAALHPEGTKPVAKTRSHGRSWGRPVSYLPLSAGRERWDLLGRVDIRPSASPGYRQLGRWEVPRLGPGLVWAVDW